MAAMTSRWLFKKASHCFCFVFVASTFAGRQVARDRRFRNVESELEQFAMNAWCSPVRILGFHASNQSANLRAHLWPARMAGSPTPKQTEAGAVPGHHCFGFDQNQRVSPTGIQATHCDPEESVQTSESGTGLLPFEHCELLPQSNGLQSKSVTRQKEGLDVIQLLAATGL